MRNPIDGRSSGDGYLTPPVPPRQLAEFARGAVRLLRPRAVHKMWWSETGEPFYLYEIRLDAPSGFAFRLQPLISSARRSRAPGRRRLPCRCATRSDR